MWIEHVVYVPKGKTVLFTNIISWMGSTGWRTWPCIQSPTSGAFTAGKTAILLLVMGIVPGCCITSFCYVFHVAAYTFN